MFQRRLICPKRPVVCQKRPVVCQKRSTMYRKGYENCLRHVLISEYCVHSPCACERARVLCVCTVHTCASSHTRGRQAYYLYNVTKALTLLRSLGASVALSLSLALARSLSHSLSLSLTRSLTLSRSLILSLSLALSLCHSPALPLSRSRLHLMTAPRLGRVFRL
jgi:hypothetical protein